MSVSLISTKKNKVMTIFFQSILTFSLLQSDDTMLKGQWFWKLSDRDEKEKKDVKKKEKNRQQQVLRPIECVAIIPL